MERRRPLAERIVACRKCPRLRAHCREVARRKRRAYLAEEYWGRPVPSFGAARPRVLVVGLAPGAHGANRTGRVFTGDDSGRWLYRALHEAGLASRPESVGPGDGLRLRGTTVTCAVRCAPPANRPTAAERDTCLPYLVEELETYRRLRVVIALGGFAFDALRKAWRQAGRSPWAERPRFGHAREFHTEDGLTTMICSYHPSRQNTQTGRLTRAMFRRPFSRTREILEAGS
jgi:uracil-DNA glycosylase family 4